MEDDDQEEHADGKITTTATNRAPVWRRWRRGRRDRQRGAQRGDSPPASEAVASEMHLLAGSAVEASEVLRVLPRRPAGGPPPMARRERLAWRNHFFVWSRMISVPLLHASRAASASCESANSKNP